MKNSLNSDKIYNYINETLHKFNKEKTNSKHYCIILPSKSNEINNKVSIGINSMNKNKNFPSIHAEIEAIKKIEKNKNKPKKVDIFVIRLTNLGLLSESRPCFHCIKYMLTCKINIINVYYSTHERIIVKEKLDKMIENKNTKISSGYRKK